MPTDKESLTVRLRAVCNGHPCATIAWPHRILHEAADAIADLTAKLAEAELAAKLGEIHRKDSVLQLHENDELRAEVARLATVSQRWESLCAESNGKWLEEKQAREAAEARLRELRAALETTNGN